MPIYSFRKLRSVALAVPPLMWSYRKLRDFSKSDPTAHSIYQKLFERSRLTLPAIKVEELSPAAEMIELPVFYPLFAGEDAPLNDLLFLLNVAKGRQVKRILEIGTYRARTTYALHLNCPNSEIVSYDIQVLDSDFRRKLEQKKNVHLRHASFFASEPELTLEAPFDLIFIDGSHKVKAVLEDSELAFKLVAKNGLIVWHDYRPNTYFNKDLEVPEALNILKQRYPIYAVPSTFCAVFSHNLT